MPTKSNMFFAVSLCSLLIALVISSTFEHTQIGATTTVIPEAALGASAMLSSMFLGLGLYAAKRKNRTRIQIIATIIGNAMQDTNKNQLLNHGQLNSIMLRKYLDSAIQAGLIEVQQMGDHCIYKATEKGIGFLADYEEQEKYTSLFSEKRRELEALLMEKSAHSTSHSTAGYST